jgi:hypothetical protein
VNTLYMQWCVDCHRHPEQNVRPRAKVFDVSYMTPAPNQAEIGPKLVAEYKIQSLTDCVTCHR